jgi:hypothetical protein
MKSIFTLWILFFITGSFSPLKAGDLASISIVHTLTWIRSTKETGLSKDHPNGCELILDGKNIGLVDDVMPIFEKMQFSPTITFRITYPDDSDLHKEYYYPAYAMTNLIPLLVSSGVHLEFYYRGKKCDIRTYWWDMKEKTKNWEEVEFFLDGVSLGNGMAAQKKLAEVEWGYEPALLNITFTGKNYPYRGFESSGYIAFAYEYPLGLGRSSKVRVQKEIYEGIAPHPMYVPPAKK